MTRSGLGAVLIIFAAAGVTGVAALSRARDDTAVAGAQHGRLHLNCPPGSHVSKTWPKFGQKLDEARRMNLEARSLTATNPRPRTAVGAQP